MSVKGSWNRVRDVRAWQENYQQVFRKRKKGGKRKAVLDLRERETRVSHPGVVDWI